MTNLGRTAIRLGSLLSVIILVAVYFTPTISAQTPTTSNTTDDVGQVTEFTPKKITIIENTNMSQIVQVGDVLISIQANLDHTEATLEIRNLTTNEASALDFQISNVDGKYVNDIYSGGQFVQQSITDYDLFEVGSTSSLLENRNSTIGTESGLISPQWVQYYWYWDGVVFIDGDSPVVGYSHPDYDTYGLGPYSPSHSISGINLYHYFINKYDTDTLLVLGIGAFFTAVAVITIAAPPVGVYLAVIAAIYSWGISTLHALSKDENGCIWVWFSKSWTIKLFPVYGLKLVPAYYRIGQLTFWDDIGQGNPQRPLPGGGCCGGM